MTVIQMRRAAAPFPWRTAAVLVALLALLLAGVIYVGSQPRLPPPFGLAGNGLVAYAKDGDILTVDPATGARRWVTSGDGYDETPRWSLDGTRIAFLRATRPEAPTDRGGRTQRVVIVDQERNVVAESVPLVAIDVDAFAWSPDGRSIAVAGDGPNFRRALFIIDTADGGATPLDVSYDGLDFYWRPGHAGQLLLRGATAEGVGLVVADVNDARSARLVAPDADEYLRPNGWTPDGRRIIYTRRNPGDDGSVPANVRLLDLATQAAVDIEAGYAHVSNDGSRLVAIGHNGLACVASTSGGPCAAVADAEYAYDGTYAGAVQWAPNDESIMVSSFGKLALLDPAAKRSGAPPDWMAEGAESWQRVAP